MKAQTIHLRISHKEETKEQAFKPITIKSGYENQTQHDMSVQNTTGYSEL